MTSFKTLLSVGLLMILSLTSTAQEFSVGINTEELNPNAVLKLVSPNGNQGIIIPKLSTAQRNGMVNNLSSEDLGLLVYDSDENKFYYWVDTWIDLSSGDILTDGSTISGDGVNTVLAIGEVPSESVAVSAFGSIDGANLQEVLIELHSDILANANGDMQQGVYDADEDGIIDNAEQVNGFTVASDVPERAVFTDSQDISTSGEAGEISISGGSSLTLNVNDKDSDPENENQTVLAGEGISVNHEGQVFEVHNTRPDKEISLADGGSGNVTIGGDYPNFTIDVPLAAGDGDSDPSNENQTVSAGTGISVNQVDQDFEVTNTEPDQVVTLADGGSGNVSIGGDYPNFTIDVPIAGDADSDPTNENQTVSAGTGISINQVDQDFEVTNTEPDQEVTLADGGAGNVDIGGSYPNFTIDVPFAEDADADPANENQTVSAGTGISINQVDQDFEVINDAPDQEVTIEDAGSGTITVGGSYPNFTLDVPAGEASLSNLNADISFLPGSSRSIFIEDNTGSGDHLGITAGTGLTGVGGDLNLMAGTGSTTGGNINLQAGTGSTNGVINLNSDVSVLGNTFRVGSFFTVDGFGQASLYSSGGGNVLDINHNGSGGDALAISITGTGNAISVGGGAFTVDKDGNTATEHVVVEGNATFNGASYLKTRSITGTFGTATVEPDDYLIVFDANADAGTIALPEAPATEIGRALKIINIASGSRTVTIQAEGAALIVGRGSTGGSSTFNLSHNIGNKSVFGVELVQVGTNLWLVTGMSTNNPG